MVAHRKKGKFEKRGEQTVMEKKEKSGCEKPADAKFRCESKNGIPG